MPLKTACTSFIDSTSGGFWQQSSSTAMANLSRDSVLFIHSPKRPNHQLKPDPNATSKINRSWSCEKTQVFTSKGFQSKKNSCLRVDNDFRVGRKDFSLVVIIISYSAIVDYNKEDGEDFKSRSKLFSASRRARYQDPRRGKLSIRNRKKVKQKLGSVSEDQLAVEGTLSFFPSYFSHSLLHHPHMRDQDSRRFCVEGENEKSQSK